MLRAVWNGTVIAESATTVQVEGNHYFPADTVRSEHLVDSATTTVCPWKGTARYLSVVVDGQTNTDAAWFYPQPKDAAEAIRDYVSFWRGVTVERVAG